MKKPEADLWQWCGRLCGALLLVAACESLAVACPSCKAALAAQDAATGGELVKGFFWSILFMMSMPFAILGVFSTGMYLSVRRARAEKKAAGLPDASRESPGEPHPAAELIRT